VPSRTVGSERVVVTGGAGFIGSHLCDALLARGRVVTCVDNLVGSGGSTRNVDHLLGEPRFDLVVEDVGEWTAGADLRGVDCVFNQAASKSTVCMDDPERDLAVNGLATLRLLMRASAHGVRKVVHASTGSVFGRVEGRQTEGTPKSPVSPYGISKLAGESYCRVIGDMFGVDYTILRYYHVIGPRQNSTDTGGVVPIFVRRCLDGRRITVYGDGSQTRSFTSVHDVVRANLLAGQSTAASGQDYNCASGISVSIGELARFVIDELGNPHDVEFAPPRNGDIWRFDVDNAKLRGLGFTFDTDWRSLVRQVIAFESATTPSVDQGLLARP
jgi:UDP-glucose 4-epimerase